MWRMPWSIFINLFRLPGIVATMHRMVDQTENYTETDRYDYVRYLTGLMRKSGHIKTQGFGMENLPSEGGYILYPNHQGKYDAYGIVAAHERPLTVVMNREKSYSIFVNEIIDTLKGKRMDVNNARQGLKIINQVAQEVAEGRRYLIFPQGRYDEDQRNTVGEFKPGCFKASIKSKTPIVPVAIIDSWKAYNSWTLLPVKTQVHYLEPIPYEQYKDMNTIQIAGLVKGRIEQKIAEIVP